VPNNIPPVESSSDILVTLLLCGLMGLLGQGIRAAIGLKNALSEEGGAARKEAFNPAYFATSLMIGFIAGDLAGVGIGLNRLMQFNPDNIDILVGIAAAGYAGVDFIENTFSTVMPFSRHPSVPSCGPASRPSLPTPTSTDANQPGA
jgi:hypothetical protein